MSRLFNGKCLAVAALFILMVATRFSHAGTASLLPDASLAVFFLAGLFVPRFWIFTALIVEAVAIDLFATQYAGVSDWCITPAYGFLLPTYAVMWGGGFLARRYGKESGVDYFRLMGVAIVATLGAFLISNLSFYAFSGRYDGMGLAAYMRIVAQYLPAYFGWSLFYIAAGLVVSVLPFGAKSRIPSRG